MAIAHGRMIHRANSEGLRRRAIAQRRRAKKAYIVFTYGHCQRFGRQNAACGSPRKPPTQAPTWPTRRTCADPHPIALQQPSVSKAAPYCGHIPPSFLHIRVGENAPCSGERQYPITVELSPSGHPTGRRESLWPYAQALARFFGSSAGSSFLAQGLAQAAMPIVMVCRGYFDFRSPHRGCAA
jgi:hypothetical protein